MKDGKVSTMWAHHPVWEQSPLVKKGNPPALEPQRAKGQGDGGGQAGKQTPLYLLSAHDGEGVAGESSKKREIRRSIDWEIGRRGVKLHPVS